MMNESIIDRRKAIIFPEYSFTQTVLGWAHYKDEEIPLDARVVDVVHTLDFSKEIRIVLMSQYFDEIEEGVPIPTFGMFERSQVVHPKYQVERYTITRDSMKAILGVITFKDILDVFRGSKKVVGLPNDCCSNSFQTNVATRTVSFLLGSAQFEEVEDGIHAPERKLEVG